MSERHRDKEKKREYDKKYRELNKDRIDKRCQEYREKTKQHKHIYDKNYKNRKKELRDKWVKENPEEAKRRARSTWMKRRYGITLDEYDKILEKQNFICAICGVDKNKGISELFFVDHCHSTLMVRGLLCHRCNILLGHAKDDVEILEKAIQYLNRFEKEG